MQIDLLKNNTETNEEYCKRVYSAKLSNVTDLSWRDIANLIYEQTGIHKDESTHRRAAQRALNNREISIDSDLENNNEADEIKALIMEYKKERYKLNDDRTQIRDYERRISREETLKEIALDAVKEISQTKSLLPPSSDAVQRCGFNEAILQISDWHYGIEVNNPWNVFNPIICTKRIRDLLDETICFCYTFGVNNLHLLNLGDLIAGRIHNTIRLESRCDVITQTITVSEILAEFISKLTNEGINVIYYDCIDNHSRLEPIKTESLDLESLTRIIPWYLKTRLKDNKLFTLHQNEFGDDIITFTVLDGKYKVGAVHGHKDKVNKLIENLTLMTKDHYDLILSAHNHHFYGDESNEVMLLGNGSLMGTDTFAKDHRLTSKASQNIILVNEESVCDYIHRIILN